MEKGEEVGDGRAEGSSAIGDGGQAAISLMPDIDGMHVCIFESSQFEGSCVKDLGFACDSALKNLPAMQEDSGLFPELEKEMATHSNILVWEIPWTKEPGGP